MDYNRDPCPWRIFDDCGGAYSIGFIGSGIFNLAGGARNAPKGITNRLVGAVSQARVKAPRTAVGFAAWGLTFASFECALTALRKKEDPWNSIMSGFGTGFVLAMRQGKGAAMASGIMGGVFLGMIEGVGIMFNKMTSEMYKPQAPQIEPDPSMIQSSQTIEGNTGGLAAFQ